MACVSDETQTKSDIHGHVVYSVASSSLCNIAVGSHSLMSKKVKAHKLPMVKQSEVDVSGLSANADCCRPGDYKILTWRPEIVRVYSRRRKRGNTESVKLDDANAWFEEKKQKKKKISDCELEKLGEDSSSVRSFTGPGLRGCSSNETLSGNKQNGSSRRKGSSVKNQDKMSRASGSAKRWVRLSYDGVDHKSFVGLQCKVYWPRDSSWYTGSIIEYSFREKASQC